MIFIKVMQVLPTLNMGNAVGKNSIAIAGILKDAGIEAEIYAENIDARFTSKVARPISEMPVLDKRDILLYQLAIAFGRDLSSFGGGE